MTVTPAKYSSIFELARSVNAVQQAALHRIYEFAIGYPRCRATPQLREKYGEPALPAAAANRQAASSWPACKRLPPGRGGHPSRLFASLAHGWRRGAALCTAAGTSVLQAPAWPALHAGVAEDNRQAVLRVSNRVTLASCTYNEERTRKPQTFAAAAASAAALDPTEGGAKGCDFCDWQQLTAEDTWGRSGSRGWPVPQGRGAAHPRVAYRVRRCLAAATARAPPPADCRAEGPHAVSASNLFKYVQPAQGGAGTRRAAGMMWQSGLCRCQRQTALSPSAALWQPARALASAAQGLHPAARPRAGPSLKTFHKGLC